MDTTEKDPLFIAKQVKFLRQHHKLTQENLADAAGLTTRTIEKVESGRHRADDQTLRSIARAFRVDVMFFEKATPEAEAQQRADMERALRKMVLTPTQPIRTASDFVNNIAERHAYRVDTSAAEGDAALEIAATMADFITEMNDVWAECSFSPSAWTQERNSPASPPTSKRKGICAISAIISSGCVRKESPTWF